MNAVIKEIKSIRSGKAELRKFGLTIGLVCGLLYALMLWQGRDDYPIFLILGIGFLVLGILLPVALRPVYLLWMGFAACMGWVMTRVILVLLFYLVVTPVGLLGRLFGKDFLSRCFDREASSYWLPKKDKKFEKDGYENQF